MEGGSDTDSLVGPSTGARRKWTPKAMTSTAPNVTPDAEPIQAARPTPVTEPITEHVHLDHVGENALEDGEAATHAPAGSGRKKWNPKK